MHPRLRLLKATTDRFHWKHKRFQDSLSECVEFRMIRVNNFRERYSTLKVGVLALCYNNPLHYRATATGLPKDRAIHIPCATLGSVSSFPSLC